MCVADLLGRQRLHVEKNLPHSFRGSKCIHNAYIGPKAYQHDQIWAIGSSRFGISFSVIESEAKLSLDLSIPRIWLSLLRLLYTDIL